MDSQEEERGERPELVRKGRGREEGKYSTKYSLVNFYKQTKHTLFLPPTKHIKN